MVGVHLSNRRVWGTPVTGEWCHLSAEPLSHRVYPIKFLTPAQAMAEKLEDFGVLSRSLDEFPLTVAKQALQVVDSDALYRVDKVKGVAEWFRDLHNDIDGNRRNRSNLIWLAVATAPVGFAHVRNTMIGTLLADISEGMDFATVSRRFTEKMHPLQYQRPQAAPTSGNIQQAEKIVAQLGIEKSLTRRFARLDEIQLLWKPDRGTAEPRSSGVFAGVQSKQKARATTSINMPPRTMTWVKFEKEALPKAARIEYLVPQVRSNYCALVTAQDQDAPPILQWDGEPRNPISWYVYNGGSSPVDWGLQVAAWCPVTGVCLQPSMWNGGSEHQGKGVFFILEGAKDKKYQTAGVGLFPEILKSELHAVRATIEAYSRGNVLGGYEESSANGIALFASSKMWDHILRVTVGEVSSLYRLDRWD